MIELSHDQLVFSFPEVHADARLVVECWRTLRLPVAESEASPLPSLGRYPLYPVQDPALRVPAEWRKSGGGMLPMYQSEAMWLSLRPAYSMPLGVYYPCTVGVEVGGLNALTGRPWSDPGRWPEDLLVVSEPSRLGGFRAPPGVFHQFVAAPLGVRVTPGSGVSRPNRCVSLELRVQPLRGWVFEQRFADAARGGGSGSLAAGSTSMPARGRSRSSSAGTPERRVDPRPTFTCDDWVAASEDCCRLRLVNSLHWCAITGGPPPLVPIRPRPTLRHDGSADGLPDGLDRLEPPEAEWENPRR